MTPNMPLHLTPPLFPPVARAGAGERQREHAAEDGQASNQRIALSELKDKTPAWAEKETLIPAAQIVRVTRLMAKAAPNHSPFFRVDESGLLPGLRAMLHLAADYTGSGVA